MNKFDIFDIDDDFLIFNERLDLWFTVNKIVGDEIIKRPIFCRFSQTRRTNC